jgi:hypothetical protein
MKSDWVLCVLVCVRVLQTGHARDLLFAVTELVSSYKNVAVDHKLVCLFPASHDTSGIGAAHSLHVH